MRMGSPIRMVLALAMAGTAAGGPETLEQPPNTWVKRSPREGGPPSPRLGYEGDCRWDQNRGLLIRYGGHNQGGGGEQNSELWLFDPLTSRWELRQPDLQPPGVCCAQQNVFDPLADRYLRFPSFSGSHGWQWRREIQLNDSSVWTYDVAANRWRNMLPLPAPRVSPLRCASWDSRHQVVVLFGGEGNSEGTLVYDLYTNTWRRMRPPQEPPLRSGGNMAYDEARGLHILFGAQFTDDPHTWAYDLVENRWQDLKPAVQPPTDQNDAVLAYDPAAQAVIALVKITTGKDETALHQLQTWMYRAGTNEWRRMRPDREPDASGNRARQLLFAPGLNLAILENRPREPAEQQIWTYRSGAREGLEGPAPPAGVRVVTRKGGATVRWERAAAGAQSGFAVYRGEGEVSWSAKLKEVARVGPEASEWRDEGLAAGPLVHHYAIAAIGPQGRPGPPGAAARAQPRIVEDLLVSVGAADRIDLSWTPPPGEDLAGYFPERAAVEVVTEDQLQALRERTAPLLDPSVGAIARVGPFVRLTPRPVAGTGFVDTGVDLRKPAGMEGEPLYERRFSSEELHPGGKPYRLAVYGYRVRAVNALGVEGGPSPAVLTIPSPVRSLFSREDGTTCRLRWSASPEKGSAGYRVYRLDGRWDKDPITRLTPEPIRELSFSDPGAGKSTRRYHLVAVDGLGQEGAPSPPVWFEREWKAYYRPFTGEWHQ